MISENGPIRRISLAAAKYLRNNVVRNVIVLLAGAVTALACGWSMFTDHSVRFNSFRNGRGFYRLPPLPIMYDPKTGRDITVAEVGVENYDGEMLADTTAPNRHDPATSDPANVWGQIGEAIDSEDLAKAGNLTRRYLDLTALPTVDEESDRQAHRNSAYDILDAMTALKQGSKPAAVKEYLAARYRFVPAVVPNDDEQIAAADVNLRDNWDYLTAAHIDSQTEPDKALQAFREHAAKYPHSEKNEAVLYTIAKLTLESSYSFQNSGCGIMGKEIFGDDIDPSKVEPFEKCRDESWTAAINGFRRLMQKYPNGRYFNDARSWLGYLYRRGGARAESLAEYYRLLGDPSDRATRLAAKKSLQVMGHEYDDATLDKVEKLIAGDRNAAMAYAYHRIYNYAIDYTYTEFENWCCYGDDKWQQEQDEKTRVADAQTKGKHELDRIVRFATAMMKRYPQAKLTGGFVLRVAESQIELQNYTDALKMADKALGLGVSGGLRAEALWIKGSSEHQHKNFAAARSTFNKLIAEFPDAKLTEGARRLLAMTAEDQGDLETALEQYLALKYDYDAAYYTDVLMETDRLAKFVGSHAGSPEYDKLLYALGVRYMRDGRWEDARASFVRVRTKTTISEEQLDTGEDGAEPFAKEPEWGVSDSSAIKTAWVMQDLKTIEIMEHLEQAVASADGDEAKAEALYQLASFQYDSDPLLFYDPAAWQGQRFELLEQLSNGDDMRLPNETQTIFEYSQSHEPLARAILIYDQILERYPRTKAAKDALFSVVVAHERLSDLNPYWRNIYESGLFVGTRHQTNKDIRQLYPKFRWPLSRLGWEASTRTVNGGPAYPALPKPPPKLSITQRIERKLKKYADIVEAKVSPKIEKAADDYFSFLRGIFYGLIAIMIMFAAGYAVLIATHFRTLRGNGTIVALRSEHALELLPGTESRVEKVIDDR